jgi:hypothetical protein
MNAMTQQRLDQENIRYHGAGGVSQNCSCGFWPAFLDTQTRAVYLSRFTDGRLAPFRILDRGDPRNRSERTRHERAQMRTPKSLSVCAP